MIPLLDHKKVDARMKERREDQRQKREKARIEMLYDEHMDQQRQFEDLKRGLASVTMEEWNNLPEIEDKSLKRKREKEREIYTPVPDSVIEAKRMRDSTEIYLDPRQQVLGGFETPSGIASTSLSAAREKLLSLKLDHMSDSVSGQTVIDPRGYMTSLNSMKSISETEIGDINKARVTFRSLINADPTNPQGWIAAARLEEQAGKLTAARKLIKEGCENCPKSEAVWLEAVHLQDKENGKIILANAVQQLPRSVKIWQTAADLEDDVDKKRRVLWRALEFIPNSVVLWKEAVSLEKEESAILLLRRAVEQVPECVELWLALAKLETYENARKTLNRVLARLAVPTEPLIWFTAAQLEEANGSIHRVESIIEKSIKSLRNNDVVIDREKWLQHAYDMERAGAIQTCGAIVRNVLGIGVEPEDRRRTWTDDGEKALREGAIETAKAIFAFTLSSFPSREDLWIRAYEIEDDFGTMESAEALLRQAVQACPASEPLWLLLIQLKYKKQKDCDGARIAVEDAMKANVSNPAILSSERLWLTAFQIEWEVNDYDRARSILQRARVNCSSGRVWMKSALLEWEMNHDTEELSLLTDGIQSYPEYAKLYMMLGQYYQQHDDIDQARNTYRKGLLKCPFSVPLWLLYVRLEREYTSLTKARSLLEIARQKCPDSEDLWIESIHMERDAKNEALANQLLAKARQTLPTSGRIWSESIITIPKIQRRTYISTALKEHEDDPYIVMAAGKLFWSMRKNDRARVWMKRAVTKNPDIGDFWAILYVFELQNGTESQQKEVLQDCVKANPHHGEIWPVIRKQRENRRKTTTEILKLVADQLKDSILEFSILQTLILFF
ncbi:hypothetical protein JH06_4931 [Blastocystis sp. subtype 4]|uniref:hypothetical protein n=1 Tax=Blastocystis sp. subtype 4 TaxID=944170 RepID=UPI0007118B46|nr:hypothetical protein JH06_4931 [Blastocystis sp. subtype 4]KNB41618.1 hypothetical protein JH06_4931 [Blastocystis sp. subtype 4]|eukprot:XP_014525061.1 hypothetical protein JH06_4931 [Blastocystis sp. subtype 4]